MEYKTKGVCSMAIQYDLDDEQKVHNVKFSQNRQTKQPIEFNVMNDLTEESVRCSTVYTCFSPF